MDDKKILLIAIPAALYGAFVIGSERAVPFLIVILIGGGFWFYITQKNKYELTKNNHLNGHHKIKISSLSKLGMVIAEGNYMAYREGNFTLDKLYIEGSDQDIRNNLSDSDWCSASDEIRLYFEKLRE